MIVHSTRFAVRLEFSDHAEAEQAIATAEAMVEHVLLSRRLQIPASGVHSEVTRAFERVMMRPCDTQSSCAPSC